MNTGIVFSLFILLNFLTPPGLAADEALNSLQRDVILAKQKYQQISGKSLSVDTAMDNQKQEEVRQEAEALMQRLEKERQSKELVAAKEPPAIPTGHPEIQAVESSVKKQLWRWPKFDFPFSPKKEKPIKLGDNIRLKANAEGISEGLAMYKVAVSDGKLTIGEAVKVALANNLQLLASKQNLKVADAKLTETKRGLFPTVQAVTEVNGGHVAGRIHSDSITEQRFYKGRNYKINFTQPLYYGGELTNTVKQAEENLRVARAEYKKTFNEFVHKVRLAYYGVVKSEYNMQYQLELFEKVSKVLKQVKEEEEKKLVSQIEVLNVESQYYQTLYQVEGGKNDVLSTNVALKQSMNLDVEGEIPVDLKLDFARVKPNFKELMSRALERNADLRAKWFGLEAARHGVRIYEGKNKVHFELKGSYGTSGEAFQDDVAFDSIVNLPTATGVNSLSDTSESRNSRADLDLEREWFLGITGRLPLGANTLEYEQTKREFGPTVLALTGSDEWKHHLAFNLFDRFGEITDLQSAKYTLLQAQSDYQNAKNDLTLQIRDDYYNLQKYLIQIDSSISKVRYQEKQIQILEYLLGLQETAASNYVENLINQAQNKYAFIQAVADYNTALSSLSVSIGDPEYFDLASEIASS